MINELTEAVLALDKSLKDQEDYIVVKNGGLA